MATRDWSKVTLEYIVERAKERRENAKKKFKEVHEEYLNQGYSAETAKAKADEWLAKTLKGWDEFEHDQLANLRRR